MFEDKKIIEDLSKGRIKLSDLSIENRNNYKTVMAAVEKDGLALKFAGDSVKKNKNIVLTAIKQHNDAFQYADEELKKDREFVLEAANTDGWILKYVDEEFKKDREIVLAAVRNDGSALAFASKDLQDDEDVVKKAIISPNDEYGEAIKFASPRLKDDFEMAMFVANNKPYSFNLLGPRMRKNPDVAWAAFEKTGFDCDPCSCLTSDVLEDEDFVVRAVNANPYIFEEIHDSFKNNIYWIIGEIGDCLLNSRKELLLEVFSKNPMALDIASDNIKGDFDVVLTAVRKDGEALRYAGPMLKDNMLIVLTAMHNDPNALEYATERIQEIISHNYMGVSLSCNSQGYWLGNFISNLSDDLRALYMQERDN